MAYEDWWLSHPSVLEKLAPNNYKVTAYYLPDDDGKPQKVYIFQGDRYIDTVERVETYNRVMAEQTDEDKKKFYHQQKKVREFMAYTEDNMIPKIGVQDALPDVDISDGVEMPTHKNGDGIETPTCKEIADDEMYDFGMDDDALALAMAFDQA